MSTQPTSKEADDTLLDMMALRTRGWSAKEIGDTYGMSRHKAAEEIRALKTPEGGA